jgi:hypothetical protein
MPKIGNIELLDNPKGKGALIRGSEKRLVVKQTSNGFSISQPFLDLIGKGDAPILVMDLLVHPALTVDCLDDNEKITLKDHIFTGKQIKENYKKWFKAFDIASTFEELSTKLDDEVEYFVPIVLYSKDIDEHISVEEYDELDDNEKEHYWKIPSEDGIITVVGRVSEENKQFTSYNGRKLFADNNKYKTEECKDTTTMKPYYTKAMVYEYSDLDLDWKYRFNGEEFNTKAFILLETDPEIRKSRAVSAKKEEEVEEIISE